MPFAIDQTNLNTLILWQKPGEQPRRPWRAVSIWTGYQISGDIAGLSSAVGSPVVSFLTFINVDSS